MGGIFDAFLLFMKRHRQWFLLPILLALIALSLIIIFGQGRINIPFVYSEF